MRSRSFNEAEPPPSYVLPASLSFSQEKRKGGYSSLSPLSAHLHTREQAEQAAPGACPRARGGPGLRWRSARPCGRRWPVPHTACWPRVRGCAAPGLRRAGGRGRRPAARGSQLGAPRAAPLRRLRSSGLDLRPAGPRSGGQRVPGLGRPGVRLLRAAARSRSISSIAAELRRLGLRPLLPLLPVSFHGGGAGGRLRGGDTVGLARSGGLELGPWRL